MSPILNGGLGKTSQSGEEENTVALDRQNDDVVERGSKQMVVKRGGGPADRFCDQLDLQKKMLEYRLHQVLDAKSAVGLEGFHEIKAIQEQV